MRHHELGWVWFRRHFTVIVELTPGGDLERAVCQVCLPPAFTGSVLSIVELGLTMTVEPGPRVTVEEDEFQEQAADYGYPPQLRADARAAIEEVRGLLAEGAGPFGPLPTADPTERSPLPAIGSPASYVPAVPPRTRAAGPASLPLTCENTNTALPYIDVVNETLEYFINGIMLVCIKLLPAFIFRCF